MAAPSSPSDSKQGAQDLTGATVGRFAIRARLGIGGMGEVYRADDSMLKRPVALKRMAAHLRADEHYRRRFLREAERASSLNNQHIAAVYDVLEESGEIFLVMEFVEGSTLRQRLPGPVSIQECLEVAVQCAEALAAAQEKGVVHCDIKPENIMLTPKGHVKVLDFGVAKRFPRSDQSTVTGSTDTKTSGFSGTPAYMAPEVLLEKESVERADIFSLGVVFYEMLSGQHPFLAGSFMATSDRILREEPAPLGQLNPQISADLERIVARMLVKDPDQRYATARELLADLRAFQSGEAYPGALPGPGPAIRVPWLGRLLGLALLVGLGALVYRTWAPRTSPPAPPPESAAFGKRLAVLPFENLSGRSEDEYFADGLTEELITKLSRVRSLEVISRVSVARFKKSNQPLSAVAGQLGVSYIVTGSVRRAGQDLRVTAALADASRETQLWAKNYDRPFQHVLAIETEIAEEVVQSLALVLGADERAALIQPVAQNPSAFDAYLRGKSLVSLFNNRGHEADFQAAEKALNEAIKLDPRMAAAYTERARLYYFHDTERARATTDRERAQATAERALAIDPRQVEAISLLAMMSAWHDENEKAHAYASKAIELNPHDPRALMVIGHTYRNWGLLEEALDAFRRAGRADPLYVYPATNAAVVLGILGRFDQAWSENEKAAALEGENWSMLLNRIWIRYHQGRLEDASKWADAAQKRLPASERPLADVLFAWILSRRGQHEQAQAILRRAQQEPILRASLGFQSVLAEGLALENQKGRALEILEKVTEKKPNYPWLSRNTNLDSLRSEPRFRALSTRLRKDWEERRARYGRRPS